MENILIQIGNEVSRAEAKHGKELELPSISKEAEKRSDDRRASLYMIPSATMAQATTEHRTKEKKLTWADIAVEELAEVVGASNDDERRVELIQLAATVVRWINTIDHQAKLKKDVNAKRS